MQCCVAAFEPIPETFGLLVTNAKINRTVGQIKQTGLANNSKTFKDSSVASIKRTSDTHGRDDTSCTISSAYRMTLLEKRIGAG